MATNFFFCILAVLLPCTITGFSFQATTGTCEDLPGKWRDIESLNECMTANSYVLGWDLDPVNANDNSYGPSWAPCGCTYHKHGTIDFWGDESSGNCNATEKCIGFNTEGRGDGDLGCFCYSDEDYVNEVTVVEKGDEIDEIDFGDDISVMFDFEPWLGKDSAVILQTRKPRRYTKFSRNTRKRSHKSAKRNRRTNRERGGYGSKEIQEETIRGSDEEDDELYWTTIFYQHTCDDVAYNYTDCEEVKLNGKLKFAVDKGHSYDNSFTNYYDYNPANYSYFWPPSDGEWRACPSDGSDGFENIGNCDNFTINAISSKDLKKAKVSPGKPEFDVNDLIKVKFENKKQYDNVWVGIYDKAQMILDEPSGKNNKPVHKFAYYTWAFTGCETTFGDEDNGSCSTTPKKGSLMLPPVGSGDYYLCIALDFDQDTQDNMRCTKESFSISGENTVIRRMKSRYDFDEKIDVVWSNPNNPTESKSNYTIQIYIAEVEYEYFYDKKYGNMAFRKPACVEVDPDGYTCDEPLKHGSFVFSEKTIGIVRTDFSWPPPSGDYRACLVDEAEDYDTVISCERFTIDPLSQDIIDAAVVTIGKEEFEEYEAITGSYSSPLKATANMWIGVYSIDDFSEDDYPLDNGYNDFGWVDASCDGNEEDHPYEGCPYRKTEGDFVIDYFYGEPTLYRGKYRFCLVFDNNAPYQYISKCSDVFEVIAPPTPAPTQAPTPAPTPLPTQMPTPVPTPVINSWEQSGDDIFGDATTGYFGNSLDLSADGTKLVIATGNKDIKLYHYSESQSKWEQSAFPYDSTLDEIDAVAISEDGSRLVISEYQESDPFNITVKVFGWDGADYNQVGSKIEGFYKGASLSMSDDGNIFAIGRMAQNEYDPWGSNGNVMVYIYSGFDWEKRGDTIEPEDDSIDFKDWGKYVSLSGDGSRVAVAGKSYNFKGKVRVYKFKNDNWKQVGNDLEAPSGHWDGLSVSLTVDGMTVAFGSWSRFVYGHPMRFKGRVIVYDYDSSSKEWVQRGNSIVGESGDNLGHSVSISDDGMRVAVGSPGKDYNEGEASVYEYSTEDDMWYNLSGKITPPTSGIEESFGWVVSLSADGSRVAMCGPGENNGEGVVRVYDEPTAGGNGKNSVFD